MTGKQTLTFVGVAVLAALIFSILTSKSPSNIAVNTATSPSADHTCDQGNVTSGRKHPTKTTEEYLSGPDAAAPRVVNVRATEMMTKTQYREVGLSLVFEALCEKGDWLKVKIVEADARPVEDWEDGWVRKENVSASMPPDVKAGLLWDPNAADDLSSREKAMLRNAAFKLLKENPKCERISLIAREDKGSNKFFAECTGNGGFEFYFSARDLASDKSFAPPIPIDSMLAEEACRNAILRAATHPSTVNFHLLDRASSVNPVTANTVIMRTFDAKNGFGLELKYRAFCTLTPAGKVSLRVQETP